MQLTTREIPARKTIALVAHDHRKQQLIGWCQTNQALLAKHQLVGTGTTSLLLHDATGLAITALMSGPMGGDQQLGSKIAQREVDALIFFWDPLEAVPHDPDVKALLRLATVWNIPVATNESSADLIISNPRFGEAITITIPDYDSYLSARVK